MPKIKEVTKERRAKLLSMLEWRADKGFDVEPSRGPSGDEQTGRWIVEVRLTSRFTVRVRERNGGTFQLDTGERGAGGRVPCGTKDVNEAIRFAELWLEAERDSVDRRAETAINVRTSPHGITVGQTCDLLEETALVGKRTYDKYEIACRVAKATFGRDTPLKAITQKTLDHAIALRMAGLPELGLEPVDLKTAVSTFKNFATVITEVGQMPDHNYESLVDVHPLRADRVKWPKPKAVRRDPASREMFELLMLPVQSVHDTEKTRYDAAPVDRADPSGQLRLLLAFVFFTGRRFEAVLQLRWDDIVRDLDDIRDLLHEVEHMHRTWAKRFRNGVVNFRPEYDKEGNHFPVPIGDALDLEIRLYEQRCGKEVLDGPIFESPTKPGHPIGQSCISKRPHRRRTKRGAPGRVNLGRYDLAMLLACGDLVRQGRDPAEVLLVRRRKRSEDHQRLLEVDEELYRWDVLEGHKIHRWRSCYATLMAKLGWGRARDERGNEGVDLDAHTSYIASWEPSDGSVKKRRYVHLDPRMLWAAANFQPAWKILRRISQSEAEDMDSMHARMRDLASKMMATGAPPQINAQ